MTLHIDLLEHIKDMPLRAGGHSGIEDGLCILEAVAYVAGEPWSDRPECVCPVISAFLRAWNDGLPSDADRDRLLKPLIPKIIGSKSTSTVERRRSYMAFDWLVRVHTPAWLELGGIADHARILRELSEITDQASIDSSAAAGAAAWAAAGAAAWAAAGAAASAAAGAAARAAARDAAGAAAWAAARAAARDAAWAAAGDAAWAAAGAAAWAADTKSLAPTVAVLQASALDLLERMLTVPS